MHSIAISLGYGRAELSRVPRSFNPHVSQLASTPLVGLCPPGTLPARRVNGAPPRRQPATSLSLLAHPQAAKHDVHGEPASSCRILLLFFLLILLMLHVGIVLTLRTQVGFMEKMKHWLNTLLSRSISPRLFMQSFNLSCLKPSGRTFA